MKKVFYSVYVITLFLASTLMSEIDKTIASVHFKNSINSSLPDSEKYQISDSFFCDSNDFVVILQPLTTKLNITLS
jgi:hypothetical protein